MLEAVTVTCQECSVELAADSPELRLELTCDDEPIVYCEACWQREFGESEASAGCAFDRRVPEPGVARRS
jgi:hypothetical protein